MSEQNEPESRDKTPTGYEFPARSREDVLADFRKVAGPPKDRDRPKPSK